MKEILPHRSERYIYRRVKHDAKRCDREFSITLEQFVDLCHKPCHYCGSVDLKIAKTEKTDDHYFGYNGLDRMDNNIGYAISNVVPCCYICNRAKNSLPYEYFQVWLENLVKFRGKGLA